MNQDGASNGLTAPNGPSQQRVIQQALANARLSPAQIDAVEAHGTGTRLGDPIEAQALFETYGHERPQDKPLWLGSVKSNIGHTAAAAGVAGVIKMVLAMGHGVLPRTLHVDEPSREIDWSSGAIALLSEEQQWQRDGEPRRAGVSSFGISGTNAHIILEEAPLVKDEPLLGGGLSAVGVGSGLSVVPWVLSGRGEIGLRGQAERLHAFLGSDTGLAVGDVGLSLAGRSGLERRAVVLGEGRDELLGGLGALAAGEVAGCVVEGVIGDGGIAFLFTGQGAQRVGMGRGLYGCFPVFRAAFDEVCERLDVLLGCSLRDVVFGVDESVGGSSDGSGGSLDGALDRECSGVLLDETLFTQTGLFALEVALFRLLEGLGVRPDYLLGHSVGELAAAYVAGVLSLDDACALVAARGRLMGALPEGGAMVAVQASEVEALGSLAGYEERVALAAVNGPVSVVLSGDQDAVLELAGVWGERGRKVKRLVVSHAFHSPRMDGMLEEFADIARGLSFSEPRIPIISNLTGEAVSGEEFCCAEYWVRHARQTVRFADGVRWLDAQGVKSFLELGPDGALSSMVHECLVDGVVDGEGEARASVVAEDEHGSERQNVQGASRDTVTVASVLRAAQPEDLSVLAAVARLWVGGAHVDWASPFRSSGAKRVELPTYAFQRERYWLDAIERGAGDLSAAGLGSAEHPLLGAAVAMAGDDGWLFTGRISLQSHPWLADHVVMGYVLLPGTALLELALRAGSEVGCGCVRELTLNAPLVLSEQGGVQLQVKVGEPDEDGCRLVGVYSRPEVSREDGLDVQARWTSHAEGLLAPADSVSPDGQAVAGVSGEWPPMGSEPVDIDSLYDDLDRHGLEYGPVFRGLRAAWCRGDEFFAEVALPQEQRGEAQGFMVHPALLDAALHALGVGKQASGDGDGRLVSLPFSWNDVVVVPVVSSSVRVCLTPSGADTVSLAVADAHGGLVVSVGSLALRTISAGALEDAVGGGRDSLLRVEWTPAPTVSSKSQVAAGRWAVLGEDRCGVAEGLAADGVYLESHPDLTAMGEVLQQDSGRPDVVLLCCSPAETVAAGRGRAQVVTDPGEVHDAVRHVLGLLQEWLADERLTASRLVVLTRGAVAGCGGDDVSDLAGGSVWGLVRSAQIENPGRLILVDVDDEDSSVAALVGAIYAGISLGEPQLAIRTGEVFVPRLVRTGSSDVLTPPARASEWCLDVGQTGRPDDLRFVTIPESHESLDRGQIRVAVRAAGLNFRDVLIALGAYPGDATIGSEGAGVVLEVGDGVEDLAPGDRVMGLLDNAFGSVAVADRRLVVQMPDDWSFAQAASVPIVFLTAYYALVDLAGIQPGERLLVHSAAGGVGMAAVQLAGYLGAEVFGTASPRKWGALEELGLDECHIASSRTLEFKQQILEVTNGRGVDVVLDCLVREFVDASLELLSEGGRFVEMGKADIRDPDEVAANHRGVAYRAFDLLEAGPERIQEMLGELLKLFESGALEQLPIKTWALHRAPEAFRLMSRARHVGKNVLTLPAPPLDPVATVLITGGTGGLGAVLARHLVAERGVRHLVLTSRRGLQVPGAAELVTELERLGAQVRITACDVSDPEQVRALIASVSEEHPLRAVVHAAGVLDDGVIDSLTDERIDRVLEPKVDGAWHLHELTRHLDLDTFVLFSSVAGVLGGVGQGNYAAANAFLDALAAYRCAQGLPGSSMAWGHWEQETELTSHLAESDLARMARAGILPLSCEEGLELFDAALTAGEALVVPVRLDTRTLRSRALTGELPALLKGLVRTAQHRERSVSDRQLAQRLADLSDSERAGVVLDLVRAQAALVLGHSSPEMVDVQATFKDLGFDSLAAVEFRNRLNTATRIRLSATLVFDYPTPYALAGHLTDHLTQEGTASHAFRVEFDRVERVLSSISPNAAEQSEIKWRLETLLSKWMEQSDEADLVGSGEEIDSATDEEMFDLIDRDLGVS